MHSGRRLSVRFSTGHILLIANSLQTFSLHMINAIVFTLGDHNKGSTVQQISLDSTDCYCFRIWVHILAYNEATISICSLKRCRGNIRKYLICGFVKGIEVSLF